MPAAKARWCGLTLLLCGTAGPAQRVPATIDPKEFPHVKPHKSLAICPNSNPAGGVHLALDFATGAPHSP
ncbi:MAG: hypothetical protein ACRD2O_17080, partial [Terriglobia bacterium]